VPVRVSEMPPEVTPSDNDQPEPSGIEIVQPEIFDPTTNETTQYDGEAIIFSIHGKPVAGSQLKVNKKTGAVFRPSEHKQRVSTVSDYAAKALEDIGVQDVPYFRKGTPVRLSVLFFFPYRDGDFGTGRNAGKLKPGAPKFCMARIDLDNLLKPLKDGMKGLIYHDDAQVVEYGYIVKRYSMNPHTKLKVEPAV
jgi:Holliday junction resolvase RusA-like endonuclease